MTHITFELGVAMAITPLRELKAVPSGHDLNYLAEHGFADFFKKQALAVDELGLYETFHHDGWNRKFAGRVRRAMLPLIVNAVALGWYAALQDAES